MMTMPPRMETSGVLGLLLRILTRPRNGVVLVGALYATAAVTVAMAPVADPDVWWVAAAGRDMLASHRVPTQNVFSFVEPSHAWLMHEWLLGPPYAWGLARWGPAVFVAIALFALAIDLSLVLAATIGRARHVSAGLFMAFWAVGGFGIRFLSARPTGVALVFPMAITLLAFGPRFPVAFIGIAALVEFVWTNTHGSFPLGIALLGLAAIDAKTDRSRRIAAVGAAAAVTVLNPYGTALYGFVWSYLRGQDGIYKEIHAHIVEFGSLAGAWGGTVGPTDLVTFVMFLLLALSAMRARRHRLRAAFCVAMLTMGALQVRHLELAGLLTCFLLVPFADDLAERWNLPDIDGAAWRWRAVAVVLSPACALGTGLFLYQDARRSPSAWVVEGPALVASIDEVADGSRLYVPFQWAGLAIWYGYPRGVRVFFDPRNDCYSAGAFREFNAFDLRSTTPEKMHTVLDATGTNAALVDQGHPLETLLSHEAAWKMTAQSGKWRVYARALP